ncbi:polyprenyl synthetase family protein [Bacillus massilinigeriensis]|uniref:polyprenyl synthetase family protein n=1 Tax=Bacillus massilionigeriensis TaxID=1805475 RepID=UPI00096B4B6A|nr:polyprenyl synthetase family protein [Bacillus massilionigeriensis]
MSKIEESIETIVYRNIDDEFLKDLILQYVDYQSKKGFPFGELLVLHYQLYNGPETDEIYEVAAAVEILILAFDILDDFEDKDIHTKPWAIRTHLALNATTAMQFLSGEIIRNSSFTNKEHALSIFFQYCLKSINAQHKDLLNNCRSEADYINMTLGKSGSLVTFACLLGASLAADEYPKEIEEYSKYIGLIGQINNDLEDLKNWKEKNDFIHRKYTLPIIYLLNCKHEEMMFIHQYYQNKLSKNQLLKNRQVIERRLLESGAIHYTNVIKKIYQNETINILKKLNIDSYYFNQLLKYIL